MTATPRAATTVLFRPVGRAELDLIRESGYQRFPPRLAGQPIFYPVATREYAQQIARDWNTKDEGSGFAGYVTRFEVDSDFLSRFALRQVGSSVHTEYWIPAEELEEFNGHIRGRIEVVDEYPCDPGKGA